MDQQFQHNKLMNEFKQAHQKMFKSSSDGDSKTQSNVIGTETMVSLFICIFSIFETNHLHQWPMILWSSWSESRIFLSLLSLPLEILYTCSYYKKAKNPFIHFNFYRRQTVFVDFYEVMMKIFLRFRCVDNMILISKYRRTTFKHEIKDVLDLLKNCRYLHGYIWHSHFVGLTKIPFFKPVFSVVGHFWC